ncbi:transcription factor ORG2 [Lactuca sativa]|uniref:BHLH domain-containing protein n=1 Tax=Lactuca sativa TaxID=4236 RepID=A0A9R1VIF1_LACSA|nr:transcription factor ORG2 [Lactuca sativa]KAJ0205332.1 hypothetical protein LSAT_V11C500286740 [Lactuca sativa]
MPTSRREGKEKMLALTPLFSTTYGWPSEDLIQKNVELDCNNISLEVETNTYDPFLDFHRYDDIQHDLLPVENSISAGGLVNGDSTDPFMVVKKLNHNASERHRRKRVNDLYGFLRSLLPISSDQKKKVSIPGTVSRAVKYIPELKKEVETLIHKKEKILAYSSSEANLRQEHVATKNKSGKDATIETKSWVVSCVRILGVKEAVIQLISATDDMSKGGDIGLLSDVLEYLEQDENGFVLLNATSFRCSGDGMSLSTLHLQVQGDNRIDFERLKEKLSSFHHQSDRDLR